MRYALWVKGVHTYMGREMYVQLSLLVSFT